MTPIQRALLSVSDVKWIRRRIQIGSRGDRNAKSLAAMFGVSYQCVIRVAKGETWKHIA